MAIILSKKQREFIRKAHSRWNIKTGAVRSGKSFEDIAYQIINEIRSRAGLDGLNVIIGVSKSTIERNVLKPMREIYTEALVGTINSQNIAIVAGEEVYCLGGEKVSQVAKIQGASIKYCYGDEIAKWNKEVFQMLKSRLDKAYSRFDGSCNPEDPNHWLKQFIDDENLDIYVQGYTIFDNPFLPKEFVDNLCKEYAGTVYFDRLILGKWVRAEGAIYKKFANNPKEFYLSEIPKLVKINIGVDFGGNGSKHSFTATGFGAGYTVIIPLESKRIVPTSPDDLDRDFKAFVEMVVNKYKQYLIGPIVIRAFCDSAEQVLIRGLYTQVNRYALPVKITNATKMSIKDRIELVLRMMGLGIFKITPWCTYLIEALQSAVYNDMPGHLDERLDDGSTPIDDLDSFEYSIESEYKSIVNVLEGRKAQ